MDNIISITILALCCVGIYAQDSDQHVLSYNKNQNDQEYTPKYEIREVIMYLTPSQIKALESQQHNNATSGYEVEESQEEDRDSNKGDNYPNIYENHSTLDTQDKSQNAVTQALKEIESPDLSLSPFENIPYVNGLPQSYSYINFIPPGEKTDKVNLKLFYPDPEYIKNLESEHLQKPLSYQDNTPLKSQEYKLVPYSYDTKPVNEPQEEDEPKPNFEPYFNNPTPQLSGFNLKYNIEEKPITNIYNNAFATSFDRFQLNPTTLQQTLPEDKFVKILRRRPSIDFGRLVKGPSSVFRQKSQPQLTEEKVYPALQEFIKPIPTQILKLEKVDVARPVPIEIVNQIPVSAEKNVYNSRFNKPHFERFASFDSRKEVAYDGQVKKPEKFTILRHVWNR